MDKVFLKARPLCIQYMSLLSHVSCVQLFVTLWAAAHQAPLSVGFSWQGYWSCHDSYRGSSWSRDRTHGSCIGRQVLYH